MQQRCLPSKENETFRNPYAHLQALKQANGPSQLGCDQAAQGEVDDGPPHAAPYAHRTPAQSWHCFEAGWLGSQRMMFARRYHADLQTSR